jgi:glycogen phosphorylase
MATVAVDKPPRERKMSTHAPVSVLQGPVRDELFQLQLPTNNCSQVGPGFTRPKHKRTATGFGAGDIKAVESSIPEHMREAWRKYVYTIV